MYLLTERAEFAVINVFHKWSMWGAAVRYFNNNNASVACMHLYYIILAIVSPDIKYVAALSHTTPITFWNVFFLQKSRSSCKEGSAAITFAFLNEISEMKTINFKTIPKSSFF